MLINYDSRVEPDWKKPYYDPRVVIYERNLLFSSHYTQNDEATAQIME